MDKVLIWCTFLCALVLAIAAAILAVMGMSALFPAGGAILMFVISVLEVTKFNLAVWLHQNWKDIGYSMKSYLTAALVSLMLLTSMSIFGFFSAAHVEQNIGREDTTIQLETIDAKLTRERDRMENANDRLSQLDAAINRYTELGYVTRGLEAREEQAEERELLNTTIDEAQNTILELRSERAELEKKTARLEAEIGPVKYVAALIYGEQAAKTNIEQAIRIIILMIVFVFDPLAVVLLIAATWSMNKKPKQTSTEKQITLTEEISTNDFTSNEKEGKIVDSEPKKRRNFQWLRRGKE